MLVFYIKIKNLFRITRRIQFKDQIVNQLKINVQESIRKNTNKSGIQNIFKRKQKHLNCLKVNSYRSNFVENLFQSNRDNNDNCTQNRHCPCRCLINPPWVIPRHMILHKTHSHTLCGRNSVEAQKNRFDGREFQMRKKNKWVSSFLLFWWNFIRKWKYPERNL